jgi:hypothetical protein
MQTRLRRPGAAVFPVRRCRVLPLTRFLTAMAALPSNTLSIATRKTFPRICLVSGHLYEQLLRRPSYYPSFTNDLFSSCRMLECLTLYDADGGKEYCVPVPLDVDGCTGRMLEHSHATPLNTFNFAALSAACSVCLS